MKILVCSDSHGMIRPMFSVVKSENPDFIFHLGDYSTDADALRLEFPQIPVASVCGNCDKLNPSPEKAVIQLDGHTYFLCHGHLYGVKANLVRAFYAAAEANADVLLFGHTHIPLYRKTDGFYMLNPGTCRGPGGTYAVITSHNGLLEAIIKEVEKI